MDEMVDGCIDPTPPAAPVERWVRRIQDLTLQDEPAVGGKGANLGVLVQHGLPVPGGFVVTADAYLDALDAAGIREEVASLAAVDDRDAAALEDRANLLQDLVRGAGMPAALRGAVAARY
ncbi:hypothetical protein B7486_68445, partial [cyanobacterium TDX16]